MKKLLVLLLVVYALSGRGYGQSLHIDSTRFITGIRPATGIEYSISTGDKGILLVGWADHNPGGIIPLLPVDTTGSNVLIIKIDGNQKISWIKVYGGSQNDGAKCAIQTPDGGYAILGSSESS